MKNYLSEVKIGDKFILLGSQNPADVLLLYADDDNLYSDPYCAADRLGGMLPMPHLMQVIRIGKREVAMLGVINGQEYYFSLKTTKIIGLHKWYVRPPTQEEVSELKRILAYNNSVKVIRELLKTPKYWPELIAFATSQNWGSSHS
jgi:hypothetical protein